MTLYNARTNIAVIEENLIEYVQNKKYDTNVAVNYLIEFYVEEYLKKNTTVTGIFFYTGKQSSINTNCFIYLSRRDNNSEKVRIKGVVDSIINYVQEKYENLMITQEFKLEDKSNLTPYKKKEIAKRLNRIKKPLEKRFIQLHYHKPLFDKQTIVYPPTKTQIKKNEYNEMLSILNLRWKMSKLRISFDNYVCGLIFPNHGKRMNISPDDFNFFNEYEKFGISVNNLFGFVVASIHPQSVEHKWYKSAYLTSNIIIKNQIVKSNKTYGFYSEKSTVYKDIFDKLYGAINNSKIFDDYTRKLDINKFFISDILVIDKSSNALDVIKKKISDFKNDSPVPISDLKRIIQTMDVYFKRGEFIPISFKKVLMPIRGKNEEAGIFETNNLSLNVKVINPPKKFESYDLDDLDYFVLSLIKQISETADKNTLRKLLGKYLKIDYNSFLYNQKVETRDYGGGSFQRDKHALYFEFVVTINKKNKRYSFEVMDGGSIKIRVVGSASATGEGSINSASLNYVMTEVYKTGYTTELTKLGNTRKQVFEKFISRLLVNKNNNEVKILYNKFINMWGSKKIITPAKYDEFKTVFSEVTTIYKNDSIPVRVFKLACILAYTEYLRDIARASKVNLTGNIPTQNTISNDIKALRDMDRELGIRPFGERYNIEYLKNKEIEALDKAQQNKKTKVSDKEYQQKAEKITLKYNNIEEMMNLSNLSLICGYELGLLFTGNQLNYDITVDGKSSSVQMRLNLTEEQKKKLILTEWSLISGRGAIYFENKKFENAKKIQDVLLYNIKMPALLKIGV